MVLVILIASFLIAFHFGAACLFAHCTDAEADLLLFLVHLDDLKLMLGVDVELDRNVMLIDGFGDVA